MTYFLPILIFLLSCVFFFLPKILWTRKWGLNASKENAPNALLAFGTELPDIKQLIGGLYEFHQPDSGKTPNVEVIFFHGLQHGDASGAHAHTWISYPYGRKPFYWPRQLLAADVPTARIFSVSYDSCVTKGPTSGRIDQHRVAENLLQDLTHDFGHRPGCPVVLVGKDIGGLIIKKICLLADHSRGRDREKYKSLLRDIRGILYYYTPHLGFLQNKSNKFDGAMLENLGLQDVNLARLSHDFNQLSKDAFNWRTKAIAGNSSIEAEELCIPEASSRYGVDVYYTVSHKLHSVARPLDRADITYSFLSELISDAISKPSSCESESSLLFAFEEFYVPMEITIQKIDEAFQKSNVVVLYGDSGTGKSSLAHHYALCFEKAMKKSSSPVVSYAACGCEAVVLDIQVELLRTFSVQDPKQEFGTFGLEETQAQKMTRLRTTLVNQFRDLDALVILDDVWEATFLEKVLVQGKNLRYLITTRDANLWPDSESIKIEDVDKDDGRQILANYAKFEARCIPDYLQVQADKLIEDVQSHPLALATLGVILQRGDKYSADEWRNLRDDLLAYMDSKRYRSVNFGESYPRSVGAALMLVVDEKFLGADAMNLLYVINLFQGPGISELLVRAFLKYNRPTALKYFNANMRVLESFGLVQVEDREGGVTLRYEAGKIRAVQYMIYSPFKPEKNQRKRKFFIHALRQQFILQQKKGDMDKVTGFLRGKREFFALENRSDDDWATVLCAISGVSSVRNEAQQKMGRFYKWRPNLMTRDPDSQLDSEAVVRRQWSTFFGDILSLLPVSIEEHSFSNEPSNSSSVAFNEVLWNLLISRNMDFHSISALLQERQYIKLACSFLDLGFSSVLSPPLQLGGFEAEIRGCVNTLIAVLAQDVGPTNHGKVLISLICLLTSPSIDRHGLGDRQECLLDTEKLLHTLIVRGFLAKDNVYGWCHSSITLLSALISALIVEDCRACTTAAVKTPDFLDKLIELLDEDVAADVQDIALRTLCRITSHSGFVDENNKIFAAVSSDLLLRIVPFLSQDLGERSQISQILIWRFAKIRSWAKIIINSPSCLQKLIELLTKGVAADQQEDALKVLCTIASHSDLVAENGMIFATVGSDLLLKIVPFLSQDLGERCKLSVHLIQNLTAAFSWAEMIVDSPSCWQKLMELLVEDVATDQQERVLMTLIRIASHSAAVDENDMISTTVASDILSRIVPFLSEDVGSRCELSIRLIGCLAETHSFTVLIIKSLRCWQKLMELLVKDVAAGQQEGVLETLCTIASHFGLLTESETNYAMFTSDLFFKIVPFLSEDLGRRFELSLGVLQNVANARSCAMRIIHSSSCWQKLMDLLVQDVAAHQQEFALATLSNIVSHSASFDKCNMISAAIASDLLPGIVPFLSQDLGRRCELSVCIITQLAIAHSFAEVIINLPSCLQKLIELLAEDVAADQQEHILQTLYIVFDSAVVGENEMTFAAVGSDLLLRIVPFLSQDLERRFELSVALIQSLAAARSCAVMISNFPSCLQKLIELLAEGVSVNLQNAALTALRRIAGHDVDVNPAVSNSFAIDTSDLERFSVRDVIERQMCNMHNIRSDIRATLYSGWCYENAMREAYPAALSDINKAVELDPDNGIWWQERGVLRRLMTDYHGALEDLNRALAIDIDDYECLKHRAFVKFLIGDENGACADAERAIQIQPSGVNDASYGGHGCLGVRSVKFMNYEIK